MKKLPFYFLMMISLMSCEDKILYQNDNYTIYEDRVLQDSSYAIAVSPTVIESHYKGADYIWNKNNDIASYPQLGSPFVLENAIYNMALDEMVNAVEKDSTLRTGKEWPGVWTRDVSYSIILSMSYMQTEVSKKSLMKKVNSLGRIIQDTGTGGAWPCSSDRMIWAVAAWEIYKVTGDDEWLRMVYPIIKNSIEDDFLTIYDPYTGLVNGESSFIDWREQSYPVWMEPVDIYLSKCLGTNAVHYEALSVLNRMASILGEKSDSERYGQKSKELKEAINKWLWMSDKNYYAQYLYGRNYQCASPKSETLGESLSILFGVASPVQSRQITEQSPLVPFGPTIFYPQIPDIPPYHNNAVWPFVSSFWAHASAKAGNESSVIYSIASIYRAAALFATNKENYVAQDGDYSYTQINSSNMLWSLSGCISLTHKLLFGISFDTDRLLFNPFVPKSLSAHRSLSGFKYRNAVLDIEISGYGNQIQRFLIDGKDHEPFVSSSLSGKHHIEIIMSDNDLSEMAINIEENRFTPSMPVVLLSEDTLKWDAVDGALSYLILKNGKTVSSIRNCSYPIMRGEPGEYQVIAKDGEGVESFASEPIDIYQSAQYNLGRIRITRDKNTSVSVPISVNKEGWYSLDWQYANGNGPINTENKCAIRTLLTDGIFSGVSIFPHRGSAQWNIWGWSNPVHVYLTTGRHIISLEFRPHNENMNIQINEAMLDKLRVTRL